MSIQHILVVDDDALSREFLVDAVRDLGYSVSEAGDADSAHALAQSNLPDLVLTDLRMPGGDGISLVKRCAESFAGLPVVVITAHGTVEAAVEAMRAGACDFMLKPCSPETLELVIDKVARTRRIVRENEYLRAEVYSSGSEIIAHSQSMRETLQAARRIARSKGTVLVTGESGTGKERIAQYIHSNSPRANGPFIRVNCAALSEQLLESELFGHERGAFTGAHKSREGRFELADSGTLLLDEIGEISPALQAKLLRVLEEEEFERVGGSLTLNVDVRVIATTNRNLADEVAGGGFREDLYYRLHVLPIHVDPLRERPDDILPLATSFVERYAADNGKPKPTLAGECVERLLQWSWPGNVRELENVIQRAVVLMQTHEIGAADLVFGAGPHAGHAASAASARPHAAWASELDEMLRDRPLADIEREAILATLESTGGNKTEAARRMGVSARTLSNKMKLWRAAGLVA